MTKEEFRIKANKVHTLKEWVELRKYMPEDMFIEKNFGISPYDKIDLKEELPNLPLEEIILIL